MVTINKNHPYLWILSHIESGLNGEVFITPRPTTPYEVCFNGEFKWVRSEEEAKRWFEDKAVAAEANYRELRRKLGVAWSTEGSRSKTVKSLEAQLRETRRRLKVGEFEECL